MYGFALRMYDQRLGRWHATDPYGQHWSPYLAMSNNPVSFVDPDGGWDDWYDRNSVTYFVDGVQVDGWEYEGYFKNSPPGSTLSMMGSMFAGMSLPVLSFSQDRGFGMWLNEKDMVAYGLHANFNTGTGVVAGYDTEVVSRFFGINNVGDYGISNTLIGGAKSVAEFSGGAIVGIGEGAWGTVKGLGSLAWGLVSNSPVENGIKAAIAVRGVGSALYNYDKTWSAITTSVSQGYTEFLNADAYGKGKTVGHVAEAVAEIFVPVSKLAQGNKYAAGAINYMDEADLFYKRSRRASTLEGYTDIVAHGSARTMQMTHNGKKVEVTHRTLARLLKQQRAIPDGNKIRLLSCSTGAIDKGFAQGLAHRMGVEVMAPTKILWIRESGELFIEGAKRRPFRPKEIVPNGDKGIWKSFH
jgi:hypothetical protein